MDQQDSGEQASYGAQPEALDTAATQHESEGVTQPEQLVGERSAQQQDDTDTRFDFKKAETVGHAVQQVLVDSESVNNLHGYARLINENLASSASRGDSLASLEKDPLHQDAWTRPIETEREAKLAAIDGFKESLRKTDEWLARVREILDDPIKMEAAKYNEGSLEEDTEAYRKTVEQRLESLQLEKQEGELDLEEAKQGLDELVANFAQAMREKVANDREHIQDGLNFMSDQYEGLYDLDPEHFAIMPTREFMELAREYSRLYNRHKDLGEGVEWATAVLDAAKHAPDVGTENELRTSDQKQQAAEAIYELATTGTVFNHRSRSVGVVIENPRAAHEFLAQELLPALGTTRELFEVVSSDKLSEVAERFSDTVKTMEANKIDRTPRQNIEEITKFIESIAGDLGKEMQEVEQKLEAFKAGYVNKQSAGNDMDNHTEN